MSFLNYYLSQVSQKKECKIKPTKLIIQEVIPASSLSSAVFGK
jgi:hypothetical protein